LLSFSYFLLLFFILDIGNRSARSHLKVEEKNIISEFIRAIAVLQVLFLNLKSFQKMLQEELFVKVVLKSSL